MDKTKQRKKKLKLKEKDLFTSHVYEMRNVFLRKHFDYHK